MISRNAPCECGSGKKFKHCCGALETADINVFSQEKIYADNGWFLPSLRGSNMRRFCPTPPGSRGISRAAAPPGILIIDGFLSAGICNSWCAFINSQSTETLEVQNVDTFKQSGGIANRPDEARIAETIDLGERKTEFLREVIRAYRDYVTRFFQAELDTIEPPSVLKYQPGGHYLAHSDSEYWDVNQHLWVRSLARDFSTLIYLNDGYEGGTLFFPNFDFRLAPKRGMLVAFPSDHRYLHAAEPLISGTRFAVVSWAKAKIPQELSPLRS